MPPDSCVPLARRCARRHRTIFGPPAKKSSPTTHLNRLLSDHFYSRQPQVALPRLAVALRIGVRMQRTCDECGTAYEARRSTSQYCSSRCRTRVSRRGGSQEAKPTTPAAVATGPPAELVAATRKKLTDAGRLDTVLGQQALLLAQRLTEGRIDTGSSLASLSKELRAVMVDALEGVSRGADPVDELKERRARKFGISG